MVVHGNVENRGMIDNLPVDSCVEGPIFVDRNGLQPVKVGEIPMVHAAINQTQINVQRLAVESSADAGSRTYFPGLRHGSANVHLPYIK